MKYKNYIFTLLLIITLFSSICCAATIPTEVILNQTLKITYNDKIQSFKNVKGENVYPISYQGTTYLPIRSISSLFKIKIKWDGEKNSIFLGKGELDKISAESVSKFKSGENEKITVILNEDIKIYYKDEVQTFKDVNGKIVYPLSYQGTTYLPIRAISNLYNADIEWERETSTVSIEKRKNITESNTSKEQTSKPENNISKEETNKPEETTPKEEQTKTEENTPKEETTKSEDNTSKEETTAVILPDKVTLNNNEIVMNINEEKTLKATISPGNVTDKTIKWSSSDKNVLTVSNGKIIAVGVGEAIITATTVNGKKAECKVSVQGLDRIHFISNGDSFSKFINQENVSGKGPSPSETIVLESNGKFALIDTGLANSNSLNPNRAKYVVEYLKKIGAKKLEFIIITHVHYDHMGGASYIIDKIPTKELYMKVYYANDSSDESSKNNNIKRYNSLYEKAKELGIFRKVNAKLEGNILNLGDMNIKLLATKNFLYYEECYGLDENINSIITYITVNNKKILLTGDVEPASEECVKKIDSTYKGKSILESIIKKNNIKNIDLLKLPHHGYSSADINDNIVEKLNPTYIVIPNWSAKINYYYKGITNDLGVNLEAVYGKYKSCRAKYFLTHPTSGSDKTAYYINNNNWVFDFTGKEIEIYKN